MAGEATAGERLDDRERLAWLRLIRSEGVGPATFRDLLAGYGNASAAMEALPDIARRVGRRIRIASTGDAERELAELHDADGRLIALAEPDYPPWLREIDTAPPLVAVRGDAAILARPMIAIVGSRNASVAGRRLAADIARDLGAAGFVIASGLARGIDAAAHEAALDSGTIAVFAGGLGRIYPPQNADLAERIIAAGGAHLSESELGLEPRARDFPRRNRIVSGLALGVVVIEAAERSGSLITARFAGEQGRVVFAAPGSPLDPRAAGSNRLLKQGATLVTEAADVIAAVEPMLSSPVKPLRRPAFRERDVRSPADIAAPESARARVLEALGPSPMEIDEIIRFTGLKPAEIQLILIELDLAGRLERHPGQRVSLI
jgi:DNA processing protein